MYDEQNVYLAKYYNNGGDLLHKIVNKIINPYGGIYQKDYDDFYSVANLTLAQCCNSFNKQVNADFDAFFYCCLQRKIKTEMTRRNRLKRAADREAISLDSYTTDDNGHTLSDIIPSDFNVESIICDKTSNSNIGQFFNNLSVLQREIVKKKLQGFSAKEIQTQMHMSVKEYNDQFGHITSFENAHCLFTNNNDSYYTLKENTNMNDNHITQTSEKSKNTLYSVSSIMKKIDNYSLRLDHPLQRESDQWSAEKKGNLISDILQKNPIPSLVFAEQLVNGVPVIWNLDGKQRTTVVYSFVHNQFKIDKKIRRWNISYISPKYDELHGIVKDENNMVVYEWKTCDIRGLKFDDLPDLLKDTILDYTFSVTQYLNCNDEDIAYHIARYNEGKQMNDSQKGITYLGEHFASIVKQIAGYGLFINNPKNFSNTQMRNGAVQRIIIESTMIIFFENQWVSKLIPMCKFLNENATIEMFNHVGELVSRIESNVAKENIDLFSVKDTFIWIKVFDMFTKLNISDIKFDDFLSAFKSELHAKVINNISYDELQEKRNNKDKKPLLNKINLFNQLLYDFFQISTNYNMTDNQINMD